MGKNKSFRDLAKYLDTLDRLRDLVYLLNDAEYVDQLETAIVLLEKYLKELKSIEKTDGHHKS